MKTRNMEANELRIGNLIQYNEGGKCKVIGIHEFGVDVEFIEETTYIEFDQFSPIPITEEWLLKFGFELKNWGIKVWYLKGFEIDHNFYLKGIDWGVRFKYVHQLQNIYFALVGEELELKPSASSNTTLSPP